MSNLTVPKKREFGWTFKSIDSTNFEIIKKDSGQLCAILNHSLLRGVTSQMIYWWFRNFQNMEVLLDDIPSYEGKKVPAYLLWHPIDHISVSLKSNNKEAKVGDTINIKEIIDFEKYGLKYIVDEGLEIFYCKQDGWAMGKRVPFFGVMMMLRIHFNDVVEDGKIIGVHYHYEVVAGSSKNCFLTKLINKIILKKFTADFFTAWQTHNTIEVGTFENFLPALYAQKDSMDNLHYSKNMNPIQDDKENRQENSFDETFFLKRVDGYKNTTDSFTYQGYQNKSFLS